MKILIDKIRKSTIEHVQELLKTKKIEYSCFGNMGQPILYTSMDVPSECISPLNLVKEIDREISLDKVIDQKIPNIDTSQYCVTKEGADYLDEVKNNIAKKYVDKLEKCKDCKLFDRCNAITTHSLKIIELELLYNKT